MFVRGAALAAVALVALSAADAARASETVVYAPAPAWVKVAPAPAADAAVSPDAPMMLILDQQTRIEKGQAWEYRDNAVRILSNQMLAQIGTLKLPWQPDDGDLIIHRVEIIRGAEHIDLIAQGQKFQVLRREEQLEQLQINGVLTATLAVEGLRVGDVLRVSFSTTDKDPALQGNAQSLMGLPADPLRVQYARARLSWPVGTELHWKLLAGGAAPAPVLKDGYNELDLPLPLAKAPELPSDAPGRFQRPPVLEAATFADWAAVSKATAPLFETKGTIAPGGPIAAEVTRIAAAESDPRKRAALALQLVQDKIRYLFKGMDGGNYTPQKPADTWTLRYGDCKAKTLLLLAILRELGIEAEPVLANIGAGDLVPQRLPSMGAFNHVLVHAKINGEDLWLDGTGSGDRLADIGDTPPFRNLLPVRSEGADLIKLQMHADAQPKAAADVELDQSAGLTFPTRYAITLKLRGQPAEMVRLMASQAGKEQKDNLIRSMIGDYVDDPMLVTSRVEYDEASATATVTATGLLTSGWKFDDEHFRTPLDHALGTISFEPDRARPAWQDIPVATADPGSRQVRTRIHLPGTGAGFAFDGDTALPPTLAGVLLSRKTSIDGAWVTVEETTAPTGAEIAPRDIAGTRSAVALAKTKLLQLVAPTVAAQHWEEVAAARRDPHRLDAITAAYKAAIAATPDKAQPYANRATFLQGIYDWKGAIADLDKALALEPDAETYRWRAGLYSQLGDYAHAIADANTAYGLDADGSLDQLATLYAANGQFDAALKLVDERIDAGGKAKYRFMGLKSDILARQGKTDLAMTAIDAAIAGSPGSPDLLNGRCWLKGTMNVALDTALKDCTRSIELADSPAAALDSRAMVYFRMNRFDDALADLQAALDIARGLPASMYMRGVIRKRMGDDQGDADIAAARMMSPTIDKDYARWGIRP